MLFDIMEQHFNRNVGPRSGRVKSFPEVKSAGAASGGWRVFPGGAAPAYLDGSDRATAPDSWFATGLAHATREVRGIAPRAGQRQGPGIGPADGYVLHDYLDQHGRLTRRGELLPAVAESSYRQGYGMRSPTMCLIQLTGPGLHSRRCGAGSTIMLSTSHDPLLRQARPPRCKSWRRGSAGLVTMPRRRSGRGVPRKRATLPRCSCMPGVCMRKATSRVPTR
jgi:hypothetical protein